MGIRERSTWIAITWGLPLTPVFAAFLILPNVGTGFLAILLVLHLVAASRGGLVDRSLVLGVGGLIALGVGFGARMGLEASLAAVCVFVWAIAAGALAAWVEFSRAGSLVRSSRIRVVVQLGALAVAATAALIAHMGLGRPGIGYALAGLALMGSLVMWPFALESWRRMWSFDPQRFLERMPSGERSVDFGLGDASKELEVQQAVGFRENAAPRVLVLRGDQRAAARDLGRGFVMGSVCLLLVFAAARYVLMAAH